MPRHTPRHARPVPLSRRLSTVLSAAALAGIGVVAVPPAATAATTCTAPVLRETMVSQGLPTYTNLVRGKTALVKFFLSLPSTSTCSAASSQQVTITGGALTVDATAGGGPRTVVSSLVTPASGSKATLAAYVNGPVDNAPGDPVFAVPGSALTGTSATAFNATFSAVLNYAVTSGTTAVGTGTTAVPAVPLARSVGVADKTVRLLVVPMGDANSSAVQFPPAASQAVDSGMTAMNRILPVADGVADLTSTDPAGLKYHVASGVVNLGSHIEQTGTYVPSTRNYMPNGLFCGGGDSFAYVSQQLANNLQLWNAENPNAPADRVLGVVSETISTGPSTSVSSCAEGYAGINTPEAWVRAVGPSSARAGTTGATASLELEHTYGGSIVDTSYHSIRTLADATAPGRAYNTVTRQQLASGRTVMHFDVAPWDDYATLYEPADFNYTGCILGAAINCGQNPNATGAGTASGNIAAGGSFVLSGVTDGTADGTDAHSYFQSGTTQDGTDASSQYRLVQRDPDGHVLATGGDVGIRLTTTYSEHEGSTNVEGVSAASRFTFDVAIPTAQTSPPTSGPGKAVTVQITKGRPDASGTVVLFSRSLDALGPNIGTPVLRRSASTPVQLTTGGTGSQPSLSGDGALVAYTTAAGVVVAPTVLPLRASNVLTGTEASINRSGTKIAYARGGSIYTAAVTVTNGQYALGASTIVYDANQTPISAPASHASWSPDGSHLAISLYGDIWTLDVTGSTTYSSVSCAVTAVVVAFNLAPCARLTNTSPTDARPNWGPNLVAYQTAAATGSTVSTVDPVSTTSTVRISTPSSTSPAWGKDQLLVAQPSGIVSYDAASYQAAGVTSTTGDDWPAASANGGLGAFQRGNGADVYTFAFNHYSTQVTVTDSDPRFLRLDVLVQCPSANEPVITAAIPVSRTSSSATFDVSYSPASACPDGRLIYRASNGIQVDRRLGDVVSGGGAASVEVYSPAQGQRVLQFQTVPVAGGGTASDGTAQTAISWTLAGPAGSPYATPQSVGSGGVLADLQPPTGGWTAGAYTLTATLTPPSGSPATTTRSFVVVTDSDGDGIPDVNDTQAAHPCYPADAVNNPANAVADYDHDLLISLVDPDPCSSGMRATVQWNPRTLELGSHPASGPDFMGFISTPDLDLSTVVPSNASITSVGGVRSNIAAIEVQDHGPGRALFRFSRAAYLDFYQSHGFVGYVPVVITITTAAGTVSGFDPDYPLYTS